MIHSLPHSKYVRVFLMVPLGLFLVSCGSYQQASYYDNDGIYTDDNPARTTEQRYPQTQRRVVPEDNNVYGNYFGQKADEYEQILESEIFTDIDSYTGVEQDSLNPEEEPEYYYDPNNTYQGYAGWGDNATSVTVNVYDNWGWGGLGFGLGYPWYYNSYWGWGNPWHYSHGYWGWNSLAWGWGGYYWGGYYGYPYYGHGYYGYPYYRYGRGGYYGYGGYAYNRSRRGIYDRSLASNSISGRSNLNTRINRAENSRYRSSSGRSNLNTSPATDRSSSKYRTNSNVRRSVGVDGIERNRSYRSSRSTRAVPRYNIQSRSSQTYRGTVPRSSTYSRSNSANRSSGTYSRTAPQRSSTYSRSASPNRSSSGYRSSGSGNSPSRSSGYRSSGSSSRSSGSIRSSSAPTRSSGTRSSGGGRRPQ